MSCAGTSRFSPPLGRGRTAATTGRQNHQQRDRCLGSQHLDHLDYRLGAQDALYMGSRPVGSLAVWLGMSGLVALAIVNSVTMPVSAEQAPNARMATSADEEVLDDYDYLMSEYDLTLAQVQTALDLRDLLTEEVSLSLQREPSFAGLRVSYFEPFTVYVYHASSNPSPFQRILESAGLGNSDSYSPASFSFDALEDSRSEISRIESFPKHDSYIDIYQNQLQILVRQDDVEEAESAVPSGIRERVSIRGVEELATSTTGGGYAMSTCTSGFTVANINSGNRGISTAGHCGNTQQYRDDPTNFKDDQEGGSHDQQWHDQPGTTFTNTVRDGIAGGDTPFFRYIDNRRPRANQEVGDPTCKVGKTSGFDCGNLIDKTYCPSYIPNCNSTFMRSSEDGVDLSEPGDSGGPVMFGGLALGVISGQTGSADNTLIYQAQDYFQDMGVRVVIN